MALGVLGAFVFCFRRLFALQRHDDTIFKLSIVFVFVFFIVFFSAVLLSGGDRDSITWFGGFGWAGRTGGGWGGGGCSGGVTAGAIPNATLSPRE